jgi:hypothetical protein
MEACLDGGFIGVTDDLFAWALAPNSLLIALGFMTALAAIEAVVLLTRNSPNTRLKGWPAKFLDARIQSLMNDFQLLLAQQQDSELQTLARLKEAADEFDRVIQELHNLLNLQSAAWQSQSDQLRSELRRFEADIEKVLPREIFTLADASVCAQTDGSLDAGADAVLAEISAELLGMLEKDGRASPVARLSGLRAWMAEHAPQLDAVPLLKSDDLWLAVVLSALGSRAGIVLPTLDTVIGAGPITDWFKCEGYDGTAPLHQTDIVKVARATVDSQTGAWRVTQPGSIRRHARRENI